MITFKVVKQEGSDDAYWKYEVIDALDVNDPTKLVQVLAESPRTFSVSDNQAKITFHQEQIAKLQAEIDATKDVNSILNKSVIEIKEELK